MLLLFLKPKVTKASTKMSHIMLICSGGNRFAANQFYSSFIALESFLSVENKSFKKKFCLLKKIMICTSKQSLVGISWQEVGMEQSWDS